MASIVDFMKSKGMDSSYANRSKLANQYGITNYTGSANQNIALLGKVNTPKAQPKAVSTPAPQAAQQAPVATTQQTKRTPQAQPVKQAPQAKLAVMPEVTAYTGAAQATPEVAGKPTYAIPTFSYGTKIDPRYYKQAANESAYFKGDGNTQSGYLKNSEHMKPSEIMEMAFYLQESDKAMSGFNEGLQQEMNKGNGVSDDWAKENYGEAFKQRYAIEDFLTHKFNLNGTGNYYGFGLDRDSLGFNDSQANQSLASFNQQDRLEQAGMPTQTAYDTVRGMFGVGNTNANPYSNLAAGEFFNREDNDPNKKFAWQNYIDPTALNGGRMSDYDNSAYKGWDYYWATELAKERNDVQWGDRAEQSLINQKLANNGITGLNYGYYNTPNAVTPTPVTTQPNTQNQFLQKLQQLYKLQGMGGI